MSYSFRKDIVPSGQDWLGTVPRNWKLHRLGRYFEARNEKVSDTDYPPLSVTMRGIVPQLETAAKTDAGDNRKRVCVGDFVINSRSDRKGSSGVSSLEGSVSLISIVLEPKEISSAFVHHLLRSYPFQEEFYRFGKGIVADLWSTNYSEMKNIIIPVPEPDEQRAIANFLDRETAKIDTLIEKQERLVKLLEEKRQAVISRAVTKGLNPDVRMKDSGVEWLGEVPEHWGISKFNYEIDFLEGPGILAVDFNEEGVPLIRIQNVKSEFVSSDFKTYLAPEKVAVKWNHFKVALEDLLISCSASTGLVSEVDAATVGAIPYTGIIRLRPRTTRIAKEFIRYLVQSDLFFEQIEILQTGATIQHFGPMHLCQMFIPLPPAREQDEIANGIREKTTSISVVVEQSRKLIDLMRERRTALISAAVTGKIDVRNAV